MMSPTYTHYIVYVLISNQYATYKELRDDYTIDEVISIYETCLISMHNKIESLKGVSK